MRSLRLGWVLLPAGLLLQATGATPAATPAPDVWHLPDLVINDATPLPKPEAWRYTRTERFEVLSAIGNRETSDLLHSLRDLDLALEVVWPALRGRSEQPLLLILCDSPEKLASFAPADGSNVYQADRGLGSVFLHGESRSAIVLTGGNSVLNITSSNAILPDTERLGVRVDAEQQLRREYTRFLLAGVRPRLPAWLEEGLTQLVMGMQISDQRIEFAKLEDPNEITIDQENYRITKRLMPEMPLPPPPPDDDRQFQVALAKAPLLGFPELFAVQHDSPLARQNVGNRWAKQCAAFVHLCLYGENQRYQAGFLKFIEQAALRTPDEAMFKSCFGQSYRQMGVTLRSYLSFAYYKALQWNVRKGGTGLPPWSPPALRDASQAEIGRVKADAQLLAGRVEEAGTELYNAYRRGERAPDLIGALGSYESLHGNRSRAEPFLAAAVASGVTDPSVYVALARLRLDTKLAQKEMINPAELDGVLAPLRRTVEQGRATPELFALFANAYRHSSATATEEDAGLMIRGAVTYPTKLKLVYDAASLAYDAELTNEADKLVDFGLKHVNNEKERLAFVDLRTQSSK